MSPKKRITVLLPAYNAAHDLSRWFRSVETFATNVVALDDGSTDKTRRILLDHPLVDVLLTNPQRVSYQGWDDRENRQRLIEAAADTDPDWLLFLDADEAIDESDAIALKRFVDQDALQLFAYGFEIFRMVDDESTYDPKGLWVYRLFAYRSDMTPLTDRRLHFVPIPTDIPRNRWLRTTIRIQHYGSLTSERRTAKFDKYQSADPDRVFQSDYTTLLETPADVAPWQARPANLPVLLSRTEKYRRPIASFPEMRRLAFSVVVIAQNDEPVIERSLSALVEQDLGEDFEVIVVGSGSDETVEKARKMMPNARCIQLPHPVLPGEARNVGIWMARGEFITFPGSHVWLTPSSLRSRLAAHDAGWELVTGGVINGNQSDTGWTSYFLDHSTQVPSRPSGQIQGPPGHASYHWRDLWDVGGFPEDMRAGEDTVVNFALHSNGRRTFFEADASFFHESPVRSMRDLARHHFKRGRALGQIICETSTGRIGFWKAITITARLTSYRLKVVRKSVESWGGYLAEHYQRVRPRIVVGALVAGFGAFAEMTRSADRTPSTGESSAGDQPPGLEDAVLLAITGRPGVPQFGLLGAGSPGQASMRLHSLGSYLAGERTVLALSLVVAAETVTANRSGSFFEELDDSLILDYYSAAHNSSAWLLLQVQHRQGEALAAVRRWEKWLKKPFCGIFFDADHGINAANSDVDEAVTYIRSLTNDLNLPTKPILVTGYEQSPGGTVEPVIVVLHKANEIIPEDLKVGSAVVLA